MPPRRNQEGQMASINTPVFATETSNVRIKKRKPQFSATT
jgi:hypothetical protein